jgi:hypothetical protein
MTDGFPVTAAVNAVTPADQGAQAWTTDPGTFTGTPTLALTSGLPVLTMFRYAGGTMNTIWINITVAGATLTAGQNFAAIVNSAGVVVASTADQSATWVSTGQKQMALTTPVVLPSGIYFVWIVANGTTPPTLRACNAATNLGNLQQVVNPSTFRFSTNGTGVIAVPANVTLANNAAIAVGVLAVMT